MEVQKYLQPSFMIIGERKCGTSSLYRYLISHPLILPCQLKEPQFFCKSKSFVFENYQNYTQLFPTTRFNGDISFSWPELNDQGVIYLEDISIAREPNYDYITGEASATYLCNADPHLVKHFFPNIKLIVILRNPTARAYSHYQMFLRFQAEGRDLDFNLCSFKDDIQDEIANIEQGQKGEIVFPGMYIENLKRWAKVFHQENLLILYTDSFEAMEEAQKSMDKVSSFLDISRYDYSSILSRKFNVSGQNDMPQDVAQILNDFYRPYNEKLEIFLGDALNWV